MIVLRGAIETHADVPADPAVGDCWAVRSTGEFAGWPDWQPNWVFGPWDDAVSLMFGGVALADVPDRCAIPIQEG